MTRPFTRLAEAVVGFVMAVVAGTFVFVARVAARLLVGSRDAWGSFLGLLVITLVAISLVRACGAS